MLDVIAKWWSCDHFRLRPLLGYEKDDLIGKKPFDLFHHEDIAAIVKCRNKGNV